MKGIRFYADPCGSDMAWFGSMAKATRKDYRRFADYGWQINCIAVLQGRKHMCSDYSQEALVATFAHNNSDVSLGAVSRDYLRKCRHIDETTARRLHPRLAQRLDS